MKQYNIHQLLQNPILNEPVTVHGWVKTCRTSKAGITFVQLNDGSCLNNLQIVVQHHSFANHETIEQLTTGCAITATGSLVPSLGKGQSVEMQATAIILVGAIEHPASYPIQPKKHSFEYLREVAHLRPRTNTFGAVTRLRNAVSMLVHQYLQDSGFIWIHTPIITANDCEGAGQLFQVSAQHKESTRDFFGHPAYLTVSGQLNAEAYCLAMNKIYTFGPTFRAENSNTSRHLAEFWMIEPEIAFAQLPDLIELSEGLLKYIIEQLLTHHQTDLQWFNQTVDPTCLSRLEHLCQHAFTQMTYTEAIHQLQHSKKTFEFPVQWGLDLQSEHERYLSEEWCKKAVFITDYPKSIKSFYMRMNDDEQTVAAMDLLVPGMGEIIGGSQREDRLPVLKERMQSLGINPEPLQWYLELRQYGSVPHGGFGLGLERLLCYITGLTNIRDVIPFPRTPNHIKY